MWYVSQVPCDMSCVMCYMSHDMWQSEFETFRKWWQVLYFWNQDDSRITIGHMTCVTDVMWHFMCHVLHVAWHVTEWIWDILKIMASTIFLKIGWLKDYYGTYGMCHRCDVTFHVMCYMSHDMCQSKFGTLRKWWQVLYFLNHNDSRITMAHMTYVTGVMSHFMSCVTCHMTCDKVNLGHSENRGKCHIFETRMSQGLQWDISKTSFKNI